MRVRTIDFSKTNGEFEIQLGPSLATAQKEFAEFKPAKISWKIGERAIDVDLKRDGGGDHFILDREFPFLLREWQMADGSRLKMKNSLKVDYRKSMKERRPRTRAERSDAAPSRLRSTIACRGF